MAINWTDIEARYAELSEQLTTATLSREDREKIQKEYAFLSELISAHKQVHEIEQSIKELTTQINEEQDSELNILFQEEVATLTSQKLDVLNRIDDLLFPPDPLNDRSVFIEIRAGAGGQEAALFAADLLQMYINYAQLKHWRVSVSSLNETDLKGIREGILHIQGKGAYGHLKHEAGVHRVQRVPKTETSGRVHTSTATVAVLPEAEDVDVQINPQDLRIDVFRASGAGGQHVNTTDSAVRITHIPSGVVVSCQDERSQHKNKAKAMKILQSRILAFQQEKAQQERSAQRKEMVGTGMRAEKVRTYNFPQNRVTDHQVNLTLKSLDRFITGEMDEVIDALMQKEKEERRKHASALKS
ncbi:peptide chain release factor 1 [Candidatus Babeliales bacterium]|nr:peptide chain release factor 1 [Candidatus Babeliales bacterium]